MLLTSSVFKKLHKSSLALSENLPANDEKNYLFPHLNYYGCKCLKLRHCDAHIFNIVNYYTEGPHDYYLQSRVGGSVIFLYSSFIIVHFKDDLLLILIIIIIPCILLLAMKLLSFGFTVQGCLVYLLTFSCIYQLSFSSKIVYKTTNSFSRSLL